MSRDSDNKDNILQAIGLLCGVLLLFCSIGWYLSSNYIVFYLTPVAVAIGKTWHLVPFIGDQALSELNAANYTYRINADQIGFLQFFNLWNLALQPISFVGVLVVVFFIYSSQKSILGKKFARRLKPGTLAKETMYEFTSIAPVISIQKELVKDTIPEWKRQTPPHEIVKNARFRGKPIVGKDNKANRTLLIEYLKQYKWVKIKVGNKTRRLRYSKYLCRQIVDYEIDAKNKSLCVPDHLSDPGKAVFAILAPFAWGGPEGKKEAEEVFNALNLSAFGSKKGFANLSVQRAVDSFNKYRTHPKANLLGQQHVWETTYLFVLLELARNNGKIGPENFIWLKPMSRILFYALDSHGRKTPHPEAGVAFAQVDLERKIIAKGRVPMVALLENEKEALGETGQFGPSIIATSTADDLIKEWDHWINGEEDDTHSSWEKNDIFSQANLAFFRDSQKTIDVPPPQGLEGDTLFDQYSREEMEKVKARLEQKNKALEENLRD